MAAACEELAAAVRYAEVLEERLRDSPAKLRACGTHMRARACERVCARASVRACVRACVCRARASACKCGGAGVRVRAHARA
jgi:hypothetical protein